MSHHAHTPLHAPSLNTDATNPIDPEGHIFEGEEEDEILHFQDYLPGRTYYGTKRYIEYLPGNIPLLITVPHGGYGNPSSIPDRCLGNNESDISTQEFGRVLQTSFEEVLQNKNVYPHIVFNRLRRTKLDMNRSEMAASEGDLEGRHAWRQYQAFVKRAKREMVRGRSMRKEQVQTRIDESAISNGPCDSLSPCRSSSSSASHPPPLYSRGLVLDLHGQSHDGRHQLGYILNQNDLATMSDEALSSSRTLIDKCSLRCAIDFEEDTTNTSSSSSSSSLPPYPSYFGSNDPLKKTSLSSIIRGSTSLGYLLEQRGHPCVPSPTSPHAGEILYFNGGYSTFVNGSSIIGTEQRRKEREEIQLTRQKKKLIDSTSTSSTSSSSSSSPPAFVDPDPAFTELFNTELEGNYFLGIQLESAYECARDTHANRLKFGRHLAESLLQFMEWHL